MVLPSPLSLSWVTGDNGAGFQGGRLDEMLALDMEEERVGLFLPAPFTKADPPLNFFQTWWGQRE